MPDREAPRIALDVGIVVANMGMALAFYRDLMGLSVVGESTTSLIGVGRMVQLAYGNSLIKLVQLEESPSSNTPIGIAAAQGIRYITLLVSNIDEQMEKLSQNKVTVELPLTQLGNGARIAMVQDPDGNIVELVQEA